MVRPCGKTSGYNTCQYWEVDIPICSYWDSVNTVCKFFDNPENACTLVTLGPGQVCSFVKYDKDCGSVLLNIDGKDVFVNADISYPFCNLIGTNGACSQYDGSLSIGTERKCRLPNSRFNLCNHITGKKWVVPLSAAEYDDVTGLLVSPISWSFDNITKYNNGDCNDEGNAINCSAYSPYHLAFGRLEPDKASDDGTFINKDKYCVLASDLGFRLPLEFEMFNIRAKISTCSNWDGSPHYYSITDDGKVEWFETKCTSTNPDVINFKIGGTIEEDDVVTFYYKCNGASSECPNYTGICWEYCRDIKTTPGDKILAEQIHELRYHTRQEKWTEELYRKSFDDDRIYTWDGWQGQIPVDVRSINLESTVVYISNFFPFEIGYKKAILADGVSADDQTPNYYDLIKEISGIVFDPIIKNIFDYDDSYGYYYETTSLYDDKEFYIYGNTFNQSNTYVINLSDSDITSLLPKEIYEYDSSYDMLYNTSFNKFIDIQKKLDYVLLKLIYDSPEKLRQNLTGTSSRSFICNINTYFGENIIAVFNKGDGNWGFTKTKFNKFFVGGLITQTDFSIIGDNLPYPDVPYYERTLLLEHNNNGGISFQFSSINHGNFKPGVSYVYNDWDYEPPPCVNYEQVENLHYTGHTIYLEIFDIDVYYTNFQVLNSGHIIITVDNLDLTNTIMPWAPDEIILENKCTGLDDDGNDIEISIEVELEIVVHGASGMLLPNQLICYPKDESSYSSPCMDSVIHIKGIWNFHKRSFGEEVEVKTDTFYDSDGNETEVERVIAALMYSNQAVDNVSELSFNGISGTVRKFQTTQIIGVAFVGRSGRVIGTTQTKMLTWIKQPYCPDVEIKYEWKKTYDVFSNSPVCRCHGKWSSYPIKTYPPYTEELTPFCGDHNIYSTFTWFDTWLGRPRIGPMWWPYNACRGFQTYTVINNQDYSALEIMTDFTKTDEVGNYIHGQHDLRMLGPSMYVAWQGAFIMWCVTACPCGRETFNAKGKSTNNSFIGYGQIRSGVSSTQLTSWRIGTNGRPEEVPKFGNASRPFLRSYRSSDIIHYYHSVNMGGWVDIRRRTKWLPTIMNFTDIDITSTESAMFVQYDSPYKQCKTLDSLGFMLAGSIDSIDINEKLLDVRLRFNDVFQTRGTNDISYPVTTGEYIRPSMPWLEFKYYGNNIIQWAWKDYWKPIERRYGGDFYNLIHGDDNGTTFFNDKFLCLDINYSEYKYDWILKEGMSQPDEGVHIITFTPATEDEEALGIFGTFKFDGGPVRSFDSEGNWDVGEDYGNNDLYKESTVYPWYDDVMLFTDDYFDVTDGNTTYDDIPEDKTVVVSAAVDQFGLLTEEVMYFQRGLNASLVPGFFWMLPKEFFEAEVISSNITSSDENLNEISFEIRYSIVGDDGRSKPIGKVDLSYYFGEYIVPIELGGGVVLFHEPEIDIYIKRGSNYYKVYNKSGMRLASIGMGSYETINRACNLSLPTWALDEHPDTLYITFRAAPTQWECSYINGMDKYDLQDNHIFLEDIKAYVFDFVESTEIIYTHERKYHISVGKYGDMAPQGPDNSSAKPFSDYTDGLRSSDTVYALGAIKDELSTVWQQDSRTGILDNLNRNNIRYGGGSFKPQNYNKIDIPDTAGTMSFVNKCRGRHVGDIVPELEPLYGDPKAMEKKQGELFNSIYNSDKNTINMSMSLMIHNFLRDYFNENGMYIEVGGNCNFHNSYVAPIPEMMPLDSYSPMGHLYVQSKYYSSNCGNQSFYWEYVQQEPLESTKGMKEQIENEEVSEDFIDTIIGHDVELQYGVNARRGVGSIYVAEESRSALGGTYLKIINEVTKYSLGTTLINERVEIMSYLVNAIYPYYYSRDTGISVFVTEKFSELMYPPVLQDYPFSYFPSDYSGYSENANIDRDKFYLYGGWNDHFFGPDDTEAVQAFLDMLGGRYSFGGGG